jgi:hypothetical protein
MDRHREAPTVTACWLEEADVSGLQLVVPSELLPTVENRLLSTRDSQRGTPLLLPALQLEEERLRLIRKTRGSILRAEDLSKKFGMKMINS